MIRFYIRIELKCALYSLLNGNEKRTIFLCIVLYLINMTELKEWRVLKSGDIHQLNFQQFSVELNSVMAYQYCQRQFKSMGFLTAGKPG